MPRYSKESESYKFWCNKAVNFATDIDTKNHDLDNMQNDHNSLQAFDLSTFGQHFLDMERLLRNVVHENTWLQSRIQDLEFNKEYVPPPVAPPVAPQVASPFAKHQILSSTQHGERPMQPPLKQVKPLTPVDYSISRLITSKRIDLDKNKPIDSQGNLRLRLLHQRELQFLNVLN